MTLTLRVLGTCTPAPSPDNPCSGYLVEQGSTRLVVDLGLAVWPALLRHLAPEDLSGIWLSHLHPDHCADVLAAYQWASNTPGAPRLPIFGPPGWADRLGAALPTDDGPQQLRDLFVAYEHNGDAHRLGTLTLAPVPMHHSVPTWGLRIHDGSVTLAYSGDSGPCPALHTLAAGADLFVCEVGARQPSEYHLTPEDAATHGAAAATLMLTHLAPGLTTSEASIRANGADVAAPGLVVSI
jgi:ribonuclease BN (tRNA processing enzyme)